MSLRFGLVGYGAWGRVHAGAIEVTAGAELVAIADRGEDELAHARARHPGCFLSTDYRDVIECREVDAVCVVVPNDLHEAVALEALGAGKHVLLEKPMAHSLDGCERLLEAARRAPGVLNVVHQLRVSSQWGTIKSLVDSGRVGEPLSLLIDLWRRPFRGGAGDWRYRLQTVGSWLLEELVHFVDLACWYLEALGPPETVYAVGNGRGGDACLHDNLALVLRWPQGRYALLSQSLAGFEHHKTLQLTGTAGAVRGLWSASMDRSDDPVVSLRLLEGLRGAERFDDIGPGTELRLQSPSGEVHELTTLYARVLDSVRSGVPFIDAASAARAVGICLAAEQSIRDGREVRLATFGHGVPWQSFREGG
ncbi:MAG: Gfo/Idh/MocA family oxidoreductase [Gammaproteobacteria bacterium]|nr:Gfo/Idh/MocA family oxidoreductase [Gammaproteobacteria bacterium]